MPKDDSEAQKLLSARKDIFSGYSKEVFEHKYEYDNKEFIEYLTNKGFYVADKSVANYCQTVLSFASSLNFEYLDNLVAKAGSGNPNRKWVTAGMRNSRVFRFLKECGYTTVTLSKIDVRPRRPKQDKL